MNTLKTAWKAFWAILGNPEKAQAWNTLQFPKELPKQDDDSQDTPTCNHEAVHTLAILQRESRLIDFIMEDVSQCDDEQLGAAVRKIHDDAQNALNKYFSIAPIQLNALEGDDVTVPKGFDSRRIRLAGKPTGEPPFKGTLIHKGWLAQNVKLPASTAAVDPAVIMPAEIEI